MNRHLQQKFFFLAVARRIKELYGIPRHHYPYNSQTNILFQKLFDKKKEQVPYVPSFYYNDYFCKRKSHFKEDSYCIL